MARVRVADHVHWAQIAAFLCAVTGMGVLVLVPAEDTRQDVWLTATWVPAFVLGVVGVLRLTARQVALERPKAFVVRTRQREFRAPPAPCQRAAGVLFIIATGCLALAKSYADTSHILGAMQSLTATTTAAGVAVALVRPRVALRPDGLVLSRFRHQLVPWDAIASTLLMPPDHRYHDFPLPLHQQPPKHVGGRARRVPLVVSSELAVDGVFLAGAISHYAAHPEYRAQIGTIAEHDRLRAQLGPR